MNETPVISSWANLKWWDSGECQVIREKIKDLKKRGTIICPKDWEHWQRKQPLFSHVRVFICGQDPYPNNDYATGTAFSIPKEVKQLDFPPTLVNIFNELNKDLDVPFPQTGDLTPWVDQGVMLWNCIPTCTRGESLSHDWTEWTYLTKEIVEELDKLGKIVFVFLGGYARRFTQYVQNKDSVVLEWSHPSPRASLKSNRPFVGCRMFSTINGKLVEQGLPKIDWRLP